MKTRACRCPASGFAGLANSFPGVPDIGLTTATEVAENIPAMREATTLPIITDADTGFRNALKVRRTVRLFERAVANTLQLKDRVYSGRRGHLERKQVSSA